MRTLVWRRLDEPGMEIVRFDAPDRAEGTQIGSAYELRWRLDGPSLELEVVGGDPTVLRSTAGSHESPIGQVVGVASEHDPVAGTERGPNTIFVFSLDGVRVAHFGDFGQPALRDEQVAAIGEVDLLIVPVGGGPTADAEQAYAIVERLQPRWVVPMHYRTHRVNFLEPADAFVERFGTAVHHADGPSVEIFDVPPNGGPVVVVPAAP